MLIMHAEYGHFLLVFALFISVALGVFPLLGTFTNRMALVYMAKPLSILFFATIFGSFVCLMYAFIIDDFTITYVAKSSNSLLPMRYKIAATWGGHEGSVLIWTFFFTCWLLAISIKGKNYPVMSYARVASVMGLIGSGFVSFMLFTSNPFDRTLPFFPIDGSDLNPLLQDFAMIIHPPTLYMGYVGFAVTFAFAIAALIEGEWNATWARWARPWAIAAWSFLTIGVALGSWWAYYELGWGGWWFWDPSENASLFPWLSGTALMHSLAITDKRNSFQGWTLGLSLLTFSLSLLGTFIIRSGLLTSVHSFTSDPERGRFILIFIALVTGSALLLFLFRSSKVRTKADFSLMSKETFLLLNNILLISACFIVVFGTFYPFIAETMGKKLSVGAPWFNTLFPIPALLVGISMGIGTLLNWKKHDFTKLKSGLLNIIAISIVLSLASVLVMGSFYWMVFIGLTIAFWIGFTSFYGVAIMTEKTPGIVSKLRKLRLSMVGMYVAHVGVGVLIVGVVMTSYYSKERDVLLSVGESRTIAGYTFKMEKIEIVNVENYQATIATFNIYQDGLLMFSLFPEKRFYFASKQMMTEADIDGGLFRDIYVALGEPRDKGGKKWSVRLYVKPFMRWVWFGAFIMGAGGVIALNDKRFRRKKENQKKQPQKKTSH